MWSSLCANFSLILVFNEEYAYIYTFLLSRLKSKEYKNI